MEVDAVEHRFNNGSLPAAHTYAGFQFCCFYSLTLASKKIQASAENHTNIPEAMFSSVQEQVQHDTAILNILSFTWSDRKSSFCTYMYTYLENTQVG